jgi:PAS domain S-box-containing protein
LTPTITTELRKTGVDVVGDMPWGTHFCLFYDTKAALLDTIVPYCKAGLETGEYCLWVVAPPLTVEEALQGLRNVVPDFDRYSTDGSIEIVGAHDWYLQDGAFDLARVIAGWNEKLDRASANGFAGVRVTGDTAWLERRDWKDFLEYEESLNVAIANQRLTVLCTYPLAACGATEILDVVRTHQFAVTRRAGTWEIIETAGHKQAKAEIKRLIDELELRVIERTSQLMMANEDLVREVFDRQRAEETLRRTQSYLADAQRLSHTGSWGRNVATREVTHWSAECFRIYGFDPDRGLPSYEQWAERIHPDDREQRRRIVDEAIHQRSDYEMDYRIVLPDGRTRHIHTVAHPLFNDAGELAEFVGTAMDVTELKRADEERERLRQARADLVYVSRVTTMGELTASLAHEIKQPVTAALLNAKACMRWLARDEPAIAEARETAAGIADNISRASEIINRIAGLFQKAAPPRESMDVNEVIQEMVALLRSEATHYAISIKPALQRDLPKVIGDRVQLQQVLMNLTLNGIDAMKETDSAKELTITSEAGDGELVVSISDTGTGIAPQHADRIFDAFYTTKPHGIGMGLAISRSIVESHGGRLWATSNLGPGTNFHLSLPIQSGTAQSVV